MDSVRQSSRERAIAQKQCITTRDGTLVMKTGSLMGRAPRDRYIVEDELTRDSVDQDGIEDELWVSGFDGALRKP